MKHVAAFVLTCSLILPGFALAGTTVAKTDPDAPAKAAAAAEAEAKKAAAEAAAKAKPKTKAELAKEKEKAKAEAARQAKAQAEAAKQAKAEEAKAKAEAAKQAKLAAKKKGAIPLDDPQALEMAKEDFLRFAKAFLAKCDKLGLDTQGRAGVTQDGPMFVAAYKEIKMDSVRVEVKRPEEGRDHTPFVGHLLYEVIIHQSVGKTKDAALNGKYETKETTMREIFRYDKKKKSWID